MAVKVIKNVFLSCKTMKNRGIIESALAREPIA